MPYPMDEQRNRSDAGMRNTIEGDSKSQTVETERNRLTLRWPSIDRR